MDGFSSIAFILLVANGYFSYRGIADNNFLERYLFQVGKILSGKEYYRLISSGFVHGGWMHFGFNMLALFAFAPSLEAAIGVPQVLLIYFASLIGGNLLALFIHRNHPDYAAVGASGAISGLIFAAIALFPGMRLGLLLLPFSLPAWLFGLLYVLYSIYGIRSKSDNIGHEAHLGGGLVGLALSVILYPQVLTANTLPIVLIAIPSGIFLFIIVTRPEFLIINSYASRRQRVYTVEDRHNTRKANKEQELNRLLEKIHKKGIESLTQEEKQRLKELSD